MMPLAAPSLERFHSKHPIDPVPVYVPGILSPEYECRHCAIAIWRVRDGTYRHDLRAVAGLERAAGWPR